MMKAKYFLRGMGIGVFITALLFGIALVFYKPKMSEEEIRREAAKLGMVNATDEALISAASDTAAEDTSGSVTVENIPAPVDDDQAALTEAEAAEGEDAAAASDIKEAEAESSDKEKEKQSDDKTQEDKKEEDTEPSMEYQGEQKKEAAGTTANASTANNGSAGTSSGSGTAGTSAGTSSAGTSSAGTSSAGTSLGSASSHSSAGQTGASKTLTIRNGENSYTTAAHLYKDGLVDNASKFNTYLEQNHYDVKIQAGTFSIPEGASYDEIVKIITRQ